MTQYRVITQRANMRNEPSIESGVVSVLEVGAILHTDPDRTPDGDWQPVLLVRGWIHKSVVEAIE